MPRREFAPADDGVDWRWRIRSGALFFVGAVLLMVLLGLLIWVFVGEGVPWIGRLLGAGGDPN